METIIAAIIGAVVTMLTTFALIRYYNKKDKNEKQVIPLVSILSTKEDDIESRLDYENDQIFFKNNKDNEKSLKENQSALYFCVKTHDGLVHNCTVDIYEKNKSTEKHTRWNVSILNSTNRKIFLYPTLNEKTDFVIDILFETMANEKMKYKVTFTFNPGECSYEKRVDSLWKKRKSKSSITDKDEVYKKIFEDNAELDISYKVKEFKDKFGITSLNNQEK